MHVGEDVSREHVACFHYVAAQCKRERAYIMAVYVCVCEVRVVQRYRRLVVHGSAANRQGKWL